MTRTGNKPGAARSEGPAGARGIASPRQLGQEPGHRGVPDAQTPARPGNTVYLPAQQTLLSPHQAAGQRAGCWGPSGARMRLPAGSQSGSPLKSRLFPQQVKHLRHQVCLLGRSSSWARGGRCCLMPGFLPAELPQGCCLLPVPQVCAVCESSPQRLTQQHPQRRRGAAGEKPPRSVCVMRTQVCTI